MTANLTGERYDAAQTLALEMRDERVASILHLVSVIRREPGNLDVVGDCLDDIARDVRRAIEINSDLATNQLGDYDATVIECARGCGRKHQANQPCLCRG